MILVAVAVAAGAGAAVVGRRVAHLHGSGYGEIFLVVLFLAVGLVLALRTPRNPIGWLFLSSSVCLALSTFATPYSILDYVHDHGGLPFGWAALWIRRDLEWPAHRLDH